MCVFYIQIYIYTHNTYIPHHLYSIISHIYICTHTPHIYTIEYYSAIKKNKISPLAATWMDLENIILSEISQRKTILCIFIQNLKKKKKNVHAN